MKNSHKKYGFKAYIRGVRHDIRRLTLGHIRFRDCARSIAANTKRIYNKEKIAVETCELLTDAEMLVVGWQTQKKPPIDIAKKIVWKDIPEEIRAFWNKVCEKINNRNISHDKKAPRAHRHDRSPKAAPL
jgi:hypothetical protein